MRVDGLSQLPHGPSQAPLASHSRFTRSNACTACPKRSWGWDSRVRRCCRQHPLPSEPDVRLFDASGSSIGQRLCVARPGTAPPAHDTPSGTRSPHWPWGQPGRYCGRAGYRDRRGPHRWALPPATGLPCPPSRLAVGSRPPTPGGSRLAFARDTISTPIRPVTGRPSLLPSSFTRRPIGAALRRAYPGGRTTG